MDPLNSEQTKSQEVVSQQQPVGSIDITGQDNANAQVNAAGNATIDQSRHIIYNYYYQQDYGQQDAGLVAVEAESASDDALICPYRGLFHFGPDDADVFFGRDVFVEKLEQAVQNRNFVSVLGAHLPICCS